MRHDPETDRIRRVYANYAATDRAESHWAGSNAGNQIVLAERRQLLRATIDELRAGMLARNPASATTRPLQLLEVGCGSGQVLAELADLSCQSIGVDLLAERLPGRKGLAPPPCVAAANGAALPFPSETFDAVVTFTVFSSVLDAEMSRAIGNEVSRVLRRDGVVIWYDMRRGNPRNPNVRRLRLEDIRQLFPGFRVDLTSCTVVPPVVRRLGRWAPRLYPVLTSLPLLHTHYYGVLTRR